MQSQEQVLRDNPTHHEQPQVAAAHAFVARVYKNRAALTLLPYKQMLLNSISDATMFVCMQVQIHEAACSQ